MDKTTVKGSNRDSLTDGRFGAYTILEHLGKGGMGDVYKALQTGLDRVVALKILPGLLARNQEFSERFFSEAYAISRLQHQNIVTIYDYGEENGQKYIAMQYIQGTTLSKIIQNEKRDYARIIGITKQICRGLKYAHQNDIIHRDIKSGNIMVEAGDKVYISDFGIAKVIDAPSITTTGMAMGTPEYMAPEQCEGGVVDGQSDIYGLGIILYEMVAGRPPFLADTPLAVAYKQVHELPVLLGKKCPDVPPRLELIVAKCLKKNKLERYRSADELLQDLDTAHLEIVPESAVNPDEPPADLRITDRRDRERRYLPAPMALSRAYLFGILGIFALILVALGYLLLRGNGGPQGINWLQPSSAEGPALSGGPQGDMGPARMLDGDRATAWAAPLDAARESGIRIAFPERMLLASIILETGYTPENVAPPFSFPRSVIIEAEGRKPMRLNLAETDKPQFFSLGGLVAKEVLLRFGAGSSASAPFAPGAVREVRFLGLPYE